MRELADAARQWYAENGRPWFYARQINALELADGKLRVGGTEFSSQQLHDQFVEAQADSAVLVAVSAGKECEERAQQLWQEGKPDEYFFLEMFGSAVVEHLVTVASGHICGWADRHGAAALPHYSPGYSGWDISDQIKLWNLIRQNGARHFDGRLDVLETGMFRPKKSLLAVFGITRHLEKARSLARIDSVRKLFAARLPVSPRAIPARAAANRRRARAAVARAGEFSRERQLSVLNTGARYTINLRALEKWSQERLRLKFSRDGAVEAGFRTKARPARTWDGRWNLIIGSGWPRPKTTTGFSKCIARRRPATPATNSNANI